MTNLQSQLADYNLLVDKLNTDTEVILVQQEAQEMAAQNESESREVEALFAEKQNRYALLHFWNLLPKVADMLQDVHTFVLMYLLKCS